MSGKLDVGIADDQARDFDFIKTEMKYDSTGMFHWIPARCIEDCILVSTIPPQNRFTADNTTLSRIVTRRP